MKIKSLAFQHETMIPEKYTCEGANINPPLEWSDMPSKTASLVLIMDDPDVPTYVRQDQMYVHWVIYNMPSETRHLRENSTPPGIQGCGTGEIMHYQGPCPPDRQHRYFFKLYALDKHLPLRPGASKEEVEAAMKGHLLASAELIGFYCKKKLRV